jgi:head-tail adaptor
MTTLIDTADLSWMRAMQNSALPGTAIIQRVTLAADGMGGYRETWSNVGTVDARLYTQASRALAEGEQGAQIVAETRWYVTMPVGTSVTAADRLSISGRLFEVTEVNNTQDWKTAVRCSVQAMNDEATPVPGTLYSLDFSLARNSQYLGVF